MPAPTCWTVSEGRRVAAKFPVELEQLGRGAPLSLRACGGGCIASAAIAQFADGSRVFVKSIEPGNNTSVGPDVFAREAEGLQVLTAAGSLRIPAVLACGSHALVLELIETGTPGPEFFSAFGRALAELHEHRGGACGFVHDNYLGASPQPNQPVRGPWQDTPAGDGSDWPEFFMQRRLRYQVALACARGAGDELLVLLDRAEQAIRQRLQAAQEPPSLLHGDLWSGNFMVDEQGRACLIDPAVYYGHRESDLAMTRLFGGFDPTFYQAYAERLPLAAGHEQRLPVYQLYHVLNHFNLFGSAYYGQACQLLRLCAA